MSLGGSNTPTSKRIRAAKLLPLGGLRQKHPKLLPILRLGKKIHTKSGEQTDNVFEVL